MIYLFLAVCALGILCYLAARKDGRLFQTVFPLEEEAITAALEKAGLPGAISESETGSYMEGHIHHVVRSETETYGDPDSRVLVASVSSANYEGERALLTIFDRRDVSEQIAWEDWKRQMVFAALLYGGFGNEEDVYGAFAGKEIPSGQNPFEWEDQLPGGYCEVSYSTRGYPAYDEDGFPMRKLSATMRVNIYESYGLYQKLNKPVIQDAPQCIANNPLFKIEGYNTK